MVNPYARKLDPAPPHTVKLFNRMVAERVKAHEFEQVIARAEFNARILRAAIGTNVDTLGAAAAILLEATA